jgi:hypothetical protein
LPSPDQPDAKLPTYSAGAAVAAAKICRANLLNLTFDAAQARGHAGGVLPQADEFPTETHSQAGHGFGNRFQQRLERVLRNQLIGLERQRAVVAGPRLRPRLLDRWIRKVQQRRLGERQHDVNVHRTVGTQAGGTNSFGEAHAPVNFHRAGVYPLHFGQKSGLLLLLDQGASHPASAEIDCKRQAGRPSPDDQNIAVHRMT